MVIASLVMMACAVVVFATEAAADSVCENVENRIYKYYRYGGGHNIHNKFIDMTPEDHHQEASEKWRAERDGQRAEVISKLPPEQRKEVEDFIKAERGYSDKMRETLNNMTDEQIEAIRS